MKIGITGDVHGDRDFRQIYNAKKLGITHLIICGDFGHIWDGSYKEQKRLNYMNKIGIKILFVDGNHENFDLLYKYPVSEIYSGKVQVIRENIIHLMRGEIYTINNKKFFTFGGAASTDKEFRTEGKSWWKQELPNIEEYQNAMLNLQKHNFNVDYIITHTCFSNALIRLGGDYRVDDMSNFLNYVKTQTNYKYWFFGHMHTNTDIKDLNAMCLYKNIYVLEE